MIALIKKAVLEIRQQQQEVISVDAMLNYLDSLEAHADDEEKEDEQKFDEGIAVSRVAHEKGLAYYNAQQLHSVEMFRSVIGYGNATLKSAMLINGGAAVALLAFIGNIWVKGVNSDAVDSLTNGIALFTFGVLAAALGTGGSYLTQYFYNEGFQRTGIGFHIFSILIVLLAFALFGFGACESYQAFVEHLTSNHVPQPT